MAISKQIPSKTSLTPKKIRSYSDVVAYLDEHWHVNAASKTLDRAKQLDAALGNPSKKISAIFVAGTNGKSITAHLAARLLRQEGLKVGTFSSPHVLTYNERISLNLTTIDSTAFTDIANEIIGTAESLGLEANSQELLTIMALHYFAQKGVDVAILEVSKGGTYDAVNICKALVATITRVTPSDLSVKEENIAPVVDEIMGIISKGTWLVTGDQSKANIEQMQTLTGTRGGNWAMPIRKLAPLAYPYEQLHGRCAALAERVAQLFIEKYYNAHATVTADSLLSRKKIKRGRPTLADKRTAELNPRKTIDQYWKDAVSELPGRFELLDDQEPSILLDTSSNIDAFKNVLLGLRLLHYKRPLKGLAIVMAASENTLQGEEFLKLIRYFFKKTSGQLFICPLETPTPGAHEETSWNVEKITNDVKAMKVKARACETFAQAFEAAKQSVNDKDGLICITGSRSIVTAYWRYRGITKLS